MDAAKYKTTTTSRGLTYNYYFVAAQQAKPTLLFCHGFPSTSKHWDKIAPFFEDRGYGVVVPDMLGYGGTSKPTDVNAYLPSLIVKDLVDILDAENIQKVIAVGHDWGTKPVSRLANHYPERVIAYAFLAVAFSSVKPPLDHDKLLAWGRAKYGYDVYGYWEYLASAGELDEDFRTHADAVVAILFPSDPVIWEKHMAPRGALKEAVVSDFKSPLPSYVTEEDKAYFIDTFTKNGFVAPTRCHSLSEFLSNEHLQLSDLAIPENRKNIPVSAPIFFGAAKQDRICLPQQGYDQFGSDDFKYHNVTIREFDGDHWIILSHADEINKELVHWIEEVVVPKANM
ncbi:epoxide hydrolase [Trametopsis cervina]|nr:epoxide hydrolase [Trametopsis cervina]